MRFLLFLPLFFISLAPIAAQEGEGLGQKFTYHSDSVSFGQVIDSLSSQYNLSFSYDASLIQTDTVLQVHVDTLAIGKWLRSLIADEEIMFHQIENQIVIAREPARLPARSIHIGGLVADAGNQEPLPLVNIAVEGQTIGTATNSEGEFELFVPRRFIGDKLSFSRLGYIHKTIAVPAHDTTVVAKLVESSVQLPEVLVRYANPNYIMEEVVRRKKQNYASEATVLTAFFREIIQQDDRYVDVSEAVIEIFKPPYTLGWTPERVRFVKGRKGGETEEMNMINFKLQGGPYLFSQVDIMRTGNFLPRQDGSSQYEYTFKGVDYEQGRMVYVVGFAPYDDTGELLYQGDIRIDQNSFAVVGATFEMTRQTIRKSREYLIRRDSRRFRTRPYFARYRIDYRPAGDSWMLNSVRGEVKMKIVDRERKVRSIFNTTSELLVTDQRPGEKREKFRWNDSFKPNYVLSEEIGSYDPDFWSRYNIIRPNESIRQVFNSNE